MSRLLSNSKRLTLALVVLAVGGVALVGGPLGAAVSDSLGFLSSPVANIQIPAERVLKIGGYELMNSTIMLWAAMLILVVFSFYSTRRMTLVPKGLQNLVELIVEFFVRLTEQVAGANGRRFLPLVLTIFLCVLVSNWLGVLPGVGTIGRVETAEEILHHAEETHDEKKIVSARLKKLAVFDGDGTLKLLPFGRGDDTKVTVGDVDSHTGLVTNPPDNYPELINKPSGLLVPFLRGANTDLNTTLAIAIVAMIAVQYWGIRQLGFRQYSSKFLSFSKGPIWFFVGILEGIAELARIISFTFRLFGNMFAGEVLLIAMAFLLPLIGIIPFIGLELFVGLIQAFIFAMLTLVFATMAVAAHGDEEHG